MTTSQTPEGIERLKTPLDALRWALDRIPEIDRGDYWDRALSIFEGASASELPAERARLADEAKRLMGAFAAQVARNVRSTWAGGPVDERAEDRARAAAEAAIDALAAAAPTPASVQPVAQIVAAARAVQDYFFEFIGGENAQPDRVICSDFGELMSNLSDAIFERDHNVDLSTGETRALGVIDPTPAESGAMTEAEYDRMVNGLMAQLGEISEALGISEEAQSCANGNDEILAAIEELKAEAPQAAAAEEKRPMTIWEALADMENDSYEIDGQGD